MNYEREYHQELLAEIGQKTTELQQLRLGPEGENGEAFAVCYDELQELRGLVGVRPDYEDPDDSRDSISSEQKWSEERTTSGGTRRPALLLGTGLEVETADELVWYPETIAFLNCGFQNLNPFMMTRLRPRKSGREMVEDEPLSPRSMPPMGH